MKKFNDGSSLVEIMVSMMILSVVVLIAGKNMVTTTREHAGAAESDYGHLLAQEKLSQLQDPDSLAIDGSDSVLHQGVLYIRSWEFGNDTPVRITVSVKWNSNDCEKRVDIAGFLADDACRSISPNNPPQKITFNSNVGAEISDDTVRFTVGTIADNFVSAIVVSDNETTNGDIVRSQLLSNNSLFELSGDTLLTKDVLSESDKAYTLIIRSHDCLNQEVFDTLWVYVTPPATQPSAPSPQNFDIFENRSTGAGVGTLVTNMGETGCSWSGGSSEFNIGLNGEITVNAGANLDYETTTSYSFSATVSRGGEDSIIKVNITVLDTNEAPVGITLSGSHQIAVTAASADIVGELEVLDNDRGANGKWHSHILMKMGGSSNFIVDNMKVKVAPAASLSIGTEQITIRATDDNGNGLATTTTFSIEIVDSNGGYDAWSSTDSYSTDDTVSHSGRIWVNTGEWADPAYPYEGSPKWITVIILSPKDCSSYPDWDKNATYNWPYGQVVHYLNNLWIAKQKTKGDKPTLSPSDWGDLGGCIK